MIKRASFFRLRYEELRKDSKYAAFSGPEFKQLLEAEYHQTIANEEAERQAQTLAKAKAEVERQAQAKAEEREASERWARELYGRKERARSDFDALGEEMARATTREELVELGRKRADLAPLTGNSYVYRNYCWKCFKGISSAIHARCPDCRWYICGSCGACCRGCIRKPTQNLTEVDDSLLFG